MGARDLRFVAGRMCVEHEHPRAPVLGMRLRDRPRGVERDRLALVGRDEVRDHVRGIGRERGGDALRRSAEERAEREDVGLRQHAVDDERLEQLDVVVPDPVLALDLPLANRAIELADRHVGK